MEESATTLMIKGKRKKPNKYNCPEKKASEH